MTWCADSDPVLAGSNAELRAQLLDVHGQPIDPATVTDVKLTLDYLAPGKVTPEIINSRDNVSVFGEFVPTISITAATQTNPVQITLSSAGLRCGDKVVVSGVVGMVELNGLSSRVKEVGENIFELIDIDGSNFSAYVSDGDVRVSIIKVDLLPADNIIMSTQLTPSETEVHRAKLVATYGGGKTAVTMLEFPVQKV